MVTKYDFDLETPWYTFFDDFNKFTAGADDWIVTTTEAGAGSATEAIADADGGILVVTNDAADDDLDFFQWAKETVKFELGKRLYFEARFKILEVIQCDFRIGLMIRDTTQLDVTDGVYFGTDDGDALLDFAVEKNNTATAATAIATLVADTYITVAFYYDGSSSDIDYIVNGETLGSVALTNMVDDEELTVSFGIQNGQAVANVLSLDYILVKKFRG